MSQDFFIPSAVPWFRDRADDVIRNIWQATFGVNPDHGAEEDLFRPAEVANATTRDVVPAAAERLIRWDNRHPNDAFWFGFPPWISPAEDQFPAEAFNLATYVEFGITRRSSIFVGTAR